MTPCSNSKFRPAFRRRRQRPRNSGRRRGRHRQDQPAAALAERRGEAPVVGRLRCTADAASAGAAARHRARDRRSDSARCCETMAAARCVVRSGARRAAARPPPTCSYRGRALGRRCDARPAQVPRPAHRPRAVPAGRVLSRRRGHADASLARPDGRTAGPASSEPARAAAAVAGGSRAARAPGAALAGRHPRGDAGQSVLRDRAAAGRRRRRAARHAGPGARALRAADAAGAGHRQAGLRRARAGSSAGCIDAIAGARRRCTRGVPEFGAADRRDWRHWASATSWRASRSRRRCRCRSHSCCTA